jgi:hypothetical protein
LAFNFCLYLLFTLTNFYLVNFLLPFLKRVGGGVGRGGGGANISFSCIITGVGGAGGGGGGANISFSSIITGTGGACGGGGSIGDSSSSNITGGDGGTGGRGGGLLFLLFLTMDGLTFTVLVLPDWA